MYLCAWRWQLVSWLTVNGDSVARIDKSLGPSYASDYYVCVCVFRTMSVQVRVRCTRIHAVGFEFVARHENTVKYITPSPPKDVSGINRDF